MKEKLAIFGGTFSPPHRGHVYAAETLARSVELDRILIMPTAIPPHKVKLSLDTAEQRLEMCRAAFSGIPSAEVCDYEIQKGGISYTYETLEHFAEDGRELYLLCGTDMFTSLHTWRNAQRIFELAHIVCVPRYSESIDELCAVKSRFEEEFGARVTIIDADPMEISSTRVREQIEEGIINTAYIPYSVAEIILRDGLYLRGDNE